MYRLLFIITCVVAHMGNLSTVRTTDLKIHNNNIKYGYVSIKYTYKKNLTNVIIHMHHNASKRIPYDINLIDHTYKDMILHLILILIMNIIILMVN